MDKLFFINTIIRAHFKDYFYLVILDVHTLIKFSPLINIINYPAVRTGFSNTSFFFWVVTCPRPPVFAQPNNYVLQTFVNISIIFVGWLRLVKIVMKNGVENY